MLMLVFQVTLSNSWLCLRGGMIQTGEQYEFVHHALSLYEGRLSADPGQWTQTKMVQGFVLLHVYQEEQSLKGPRANYSFSYQETI